MSVVGKRIRYEPDERVREAVLCWNPNRPRRWLAKYGGLVCMGGDDNAQTFRLIRSAAEALTARKRLCEEGDCLPEGTFRVAY